MAILQISRIQQRRGLQQDLPQLAPGEMGWSTDTNRLYIGNGSIADGSPSPGQNTEILTQYSISGFTTTFSSTLANVISNVSALTSAVAAVEATLLQNQYVVLPAASTGQISTIGANNAVISYTLFQGVNQRTGTIKMAWYPSTSAISYDEDYTETATTDIVFDMNANSTQANLNYTTSSTTALLYSVVSL